MDGQVARWVADIQGDPRQLTKSKRLVHPEESHNMKASWMQNVTEICTF